MSTLVLTLAATPDFDLDLSGLTPDALRPKRLNEIRRLKLRQGRKAVALGDLFEIDGEPGGDELEIHGATRRLQRVGAGMTAGVLRVRGDCGDWLASEMRGGRLELTGSAGDCVAAGLRGGHVEVSGSVGDFLGAPVPGAVSGMRGGTVVVGRNAGARVGDRMRRGFIAIGGDAGSHCGSQLIAGSIVVLGDTGPGLGLGMRRGTIALFGAPADLGANFVHTGRYELAFTQLLLRHLAGLKRAWRGRLGKVSAAERWVGDAGAAGLGEVLVLG
jgi:formylmethanofuran dehydrogenase subunit C